MFRFIFFFLLNHFLVSFVSSTFHSIWLTFIWLSPIVVIFFDYYKYMHKLDFVAFMEYYRCIFLPTHSLFLSHLWAVCCVWAEIGIFSFVTITFYFICVEIFKYHFFFYLPLWILIWVNKIDRHIKNTHIFDITNDDMYSVEEFHETRELLSDKMIELR